MPAELGSALIGHTGYVGGTLLRARQFDRTYNSANIADIDGMHFDEIVCAGVSAAKWKANQDPDADAAAIERLTAALSGATTRRFTLISTIDVYPSPDTTADEDTYLDGTSNHAYGRHRLALERWVQNRFEHSQTVRLPALFGSGLRKNALYDLIHARAGSAVQPDSVFQWYPMRHLAADLATIGQSSETLVNLFTEPVPMSDILDAFFPGSALVSRAAPRASYRLETAKAALFGRTGRYRFVAEEVLGEMARFVADERRTATASVGEAA